MRQIPTLKARVAAFERAAAAATDPKTMAAKISEKSDRKKYAFADGLARDLANTRAALRTCAQARMSERVEDISGRMYCTFGELFEQTGGKIANLNRILQNLRSAGEIAYQPEVCFSSMHNKEEIDPLEIFWAQDSMYEVNSENVFRPGRPTMDIPEAARRGRSYVKENLATINVKECALCGKEVAALDRMTIRNDVYHIRCIQCMVCGANPSKKADFLTFDGGVCCGTECVRMYDAAHLKQERG
mmetsp:Transcript_20114/g.58162  ORF Transcript_20114/g.58162 Transcript_20114/m.58162 type:complete len:245 (-) Transcript_20114:184-918(-)